LHDKGIDGIEELMRIYDLRGSDETTLDIVASPVAAFNSHSTVRGRHVVVGFSLAQDLERESFNIAVRNADTNARDVPRTLNGRDIVWTEHSDCGSARWEFDLPQNEVIDCRLVYAGCVQAEQRFADPHSLPNPLRMIVELVDPGCARLDKILTAPAKRQSEDFETGIAWLLQLLGFTAIHVSGLSNMTDEPDILVASPSGAVLIVECTIGVPDDDKLTMLISRTVRMRELQQSQNGTTSSEVIPLLVTPRSRDELVGIRAKADKHGIILLCRAEITDAVERTQFPPDAAAVIQHWKQLGLVRIMTGEQPLVG